MANRIQAVLRGPRGKESAAVHLVFEAAAAAEERDAVTPGINEARRTAGGEFERHWARGVELPWEDAAAIALAWRADAGSAGVRELERPTDG